MPTNLQLELMLLREKSRGYTTTSLQGAVAKGDLKRVQELCGGSKEQCSQANDQGDLPLHTAFKNSHLEVAKFLVPIEPNLILVNNNEDESPLYLAIYHGHRGLVETMFRCLKPLGNIDLSRFPQRKSFLRAAIVAKDTDMLSIIFDERPDLIGLIDEDGLRPFSRAVCCAYLPVIKYFINRFTPELLFKKDNDNNESYPIHHACMEGKIDVVREVCTYFGGTSLMQANQFGQNVLHVAASNGHAKVVTYLLGLANVRELVNLKDSWGQTPRSSANGNLEVIEAFKRAGY